MNIDNVTPLEYPSPAGVSRGRDLVPLFPAQPPAEIPGEKSKTHDVHRPETPFGVVTRNIDVRHISPREMTDFSLDLYAAGVVAFDEYSALSLHPELHPDFDKTIGALTGDRAAPDRKRDFLGYWEEKLSFQERRSSPNPEELDRTRRIVTVLRVIGRRTHIVV